MSVDLEQVVFDRVRHKVLQRADLVASLLAVMGTPSVDRARAVEVLRTARDAFARLGWDEGVRQVDSLLASLP